MTTIFDKPTIGDLILTYRKKHHLRREILAERLGVRPETVHNWETGVSKPSIKALIRIADEMNVPLGTLYAIRQNR